MSETNDLRNAATFAALAVFVATPNTTNRDALIAAYNARDNARFYVVGGTNLILFRNGREIRVAQFERSEFAEVIKDRLNLDLDNGWIPVLP